MKEVFNRAMSLMPLATSLFLLGACGGSMPAASIDSATATAASSLTSDEEAPQALRALGPGWVQTAPGVAEKWQGTAILHAAFNERGQQWMRQRYEQALQQQERAYAQDPSPARAQHMEVLRNALHDADARSSRGETTPAEVSSMASADFTGTELCSADAGGAVFSVYTMTRWQADFPLFGEAAAVAGSDSKWDGRTLASGVASTFATTRGAFGVPIPGFRGHQVSGSDPSTGKAVYFGAAYTLSCTVPRVPDPPTACTVPGYIECFDGCGNDYCYYGTHCPTPRRGVDPPTPCR